MLHPHPPPAPWRLISPLPGQQWERCWPIRWGTKAGVRLLGIHRWMGQSPSYLASTHKNKVNERNGHKKEWKQVWVPFTPWPLCGGWVGLTWVFLKKQGFIQSNSDSSIYTKFEQSDVFIIAVYNDELVLDCKSLNNINKMKEVLSANNKMKG